MEYFGNALDEDVTLSNSGIAADISVILRAPSQVCTRTDQGLYDQLDPILSRAGEPLVQSVRFLASFEASSLLIECCQRIGFGRVLTGKHREYALAVLRALSEGKSAQEAMLTNKPGRRRREDVRNIRDGSQGQDIDSQDIYLAVRRRADGKERDATGAFLQRCGWNAAQEWIAEQRDVDVKTIQRACKAFAKIAGIPPLPSGRPRKGT